MKAWMLLLMVMFCSQSLLAFDDRIDADFERRINNIYKASYAKVVTDAEWNFFMDKVESENYEVRVGDTLWELSTIFFGDGNYWPKIWSLNSRITNPHLIYPSAVIQFFAGSIGQAPGIQVVPGGTKPPSPSELSVPDTVYEPVADSETSEPMNEHAAAYTQVAPSKLYPGAPSIPPALSKVTPVPKQIPPAFATSSFQITKYDDQGLSLDVRPPSPVKARLSPHAFLYEGNIGRYPSTGKVVEMEHGQEIAGFNEIVYIKVNKEYAVGDVVTVLGKEYEFSYGKFSGTVVRYMGAIKILEAISSDGYRARVVTSIMPIERNALLADETIPMFNDDVGRQNATELFIIGGVFDDERGLFGQNDVIFLSGGSKQGVAEGDSFAIYKNRTVRYDNSNYWKSPQPIGVVKVFRVENNVSSAIVLWLQEALVRLDTTGSFVTGPLNIGEGEREDLNKLEGELEREEEYQETESPKAADDARTEVDEEENEDVNLTDDDDEFKDFEDSDLPEDEDEDKEFRELEAGAAGAQGSEKATSAGAATNEAAEDDTEASDGAQSQEPVDDDDDGGEGRAEGADDEDLGDDADDLPADESSLGDDQDSLEEDLENFDSE